MPSGLQTVASPGHRRSAEPCPRLHRGARPAGDRHREGHGGSQARRHRAQERRPYTDANQGRHRSAVHKPEGRTSSEYVSDLYRVACGAGRFHVCWSAGRHHVLWARIQRTDADQTGLRIRAGDAPPRSARDDAPTREWQVRLTPPYGRIVIFLMTGGVSGLLWAPSDPAVVGVSASASRTSKPEVTLPKMT